MSKPWSRRRKIVLSILAVIVVAGAFGLYWFQPWKLFIDHRVDETLPTVVAEQPVDATPTGTPSGTPSGTTTSKASEAPKNVSTLLSRGSLITHEHDTSGTVSIVRKPDGHRVLTLANLDTSDGPDVEVWLTDAKVVPGEKGWYLFDDGKHVSLGDLKGNQGNQVYDIPDGLDLSQYSSVSLWCARFDVSFGAAELTP